MYIPSYMRVADEEIMRELIGQHSFGMLVTVHDGRPLASHLPFLVRAGGEHGRLVAHVARANEQWQDFGAGGEALAVFQGDHAYVSPSWHESHPSVPTWDYMVVHAYGAPRLIEEQTEVREYLESLVRRYEAGRRSPWQMDVPEDYYARMVRGIVAFEMPIERLEGKFKLSQNRSTTELQRIVEALGQSEDAKSRGIASAIDALLRDAEAAGR